MTILNFIIVILTLILALIGLFFYFGAIVISCIKCWKNCCEKKIKRNYVESLAKVAVSVAIIIICVLIYLHI